MSTHKPGVVSVVIVNFRGVDDTITAIQHLRALDWPASKLEIVVVENASGDDSAARIRAADPDVTLIESSTNLGFAGGCNLGVAASSGEFIALLNNDARPDARWIAAAVTAFSRSPRIGAVASRVLDWDGEKVDYIGAALTWYGMGYKPMTGDPVPRFADSSRDVLFGTGSAMFVRRSVFDELGGFDESYFMFFEDVDLGWRLNLLGYRFVYEPESLAYHKHHASMASFGAHKETLLLERNALATLYKNSSDDTLASALPAALMLAVRRGMTRAPVDSGSFDLRTPGGNEPQMNIPRMAAAPLVAIDQFVDALPGLRASRDRIQAGRRVSDGAIWRLFGMADAPVLQDEEYLRGYENIVTAFDVSERPPTARVLVITGDPIGSKLAGPAIRAWNMAEAFARTADVTLVTLSGAEPISAPFAIVHVRPGDERTFARWEKWADVIVFQGHALAIFDSLRRSEKILVADIYDPMHLEQLEQGRELGAEAWTKQVSDATDVLNEQLLRADFIVCASERQRHFYLGQLAALGRINPKNYDGDPDLRDLIDVVPFGLSDSPPRHENDVVKGVRPGVAKGDKLLLWSGGLYNWFDPRTLIRAVGVVSARRGGGVHLYFQGTKNPNPHVPEMAIVRESRELARELGLLDTAVHFNESWVDFADRQNYLTEADAGVSTHYAHVETTYSFRTRILDYLWAGLPMVVTRGDHFAELVEREMLGVAVDAEDVDALALALEKVLFDEEFAALARANIALVREQYKWEAVLTPLTSFLSSPRPAADRDVLAGGPMEGRPRRRRKRSGIRHDISLVLFYMKNGGPSTVLRKVRNRLRKR
ncbi:glycosyltransferase [Microcella alkalica]|uniref:Glycosyltransferase 2-like domain-containing protein n=1 Tax=Microcella alkalica TaxID=355930 RepID=A0A839EB33_9MICO|nr:glycosyltransferase [Microcella alkalica]MBA8848940.1 hypothetical protein [Microcella alkalica]